MGTAGQRGEQAMRANKGSAMSYGKVDRSLVLLVMRGSMPTFHEVAQAVSRRLQSAYLSQRKSKRRREQLH